MTTHSSQAGLSSMRAGHVYRIGSDHQPREVTPGSEVERLRAEVERLTVRVRRLQHHKDRNASQRDEARAGVERLRATIARVEALLDRPTKILRSDLRTALEGETND